MIKHLTKRIRAIRFMVMAFLMAASLPVSTSARIVDKSMICSGEMGNGYSNTRPEYKVFATRTFYLTTHCSLKTATIIKSGKCDYTFDGSRYEGYLYEDGAFALYHLSRINIVQPDGYLMFKMSEMTNGQGGNEGQRWFSGQCTVQ